MPGLTVTKRTLFGHQVPISFLTQSSDMDNDDLAGRPSQLSARTPRPLPVSTAGVQKEREATLGSQLR